MTVPLTYAQELLDEVERHDPARIRRPRFTVERSYTVTGAIDPAALAAALDDVVVRHEALRTVRDGAGQRILPPVPVGLDTGGGGFDGPLPGGQVPALRARLVGGRLDLAAHHGAADPWSLTVIARDVVTAYHARLAGGRLDASVMQYADIAADDRSPQWQKRIAEVVPRWRERLCGLGPSGPPTLSSEGERTYPLAVVTFTLGDDLWRAVGATARRARSTPFTLLLAAFAAALYPPGDTAEAVLPVITPGRIPSEWDTVGFLLNVLTVRLPMTGDPDPAELLRRVDTACRQAYADDIPLVPVLRAVPGLLDVLAGARAAPAFRYIARPAMTPPIEEPRFTLTPLGTETPPSVILGTPILVTIHPGGRGEVAYDPGLVAASHVERLVDAYLAVLPAFAGAGR